MKIKRWLAFAIFAAGFAGALWRAQPPAAPRIATSAAPAAAELPPEFSSADLPSAAPSAHAASLAELPDGRIAAAWFAGSREGAADVAIWLATRQDGRWTAPRAILTRQQLAAATLTHVRKLGNPVLFAAGPRLHLWVAAASVGGWAGSAVHALHSDDDGLHWSTPRRLATSPLFNYGTLVRTPPLPLADGGFGLPVYHELIAKRGEWLRLAANGDIVAKTRMPANSAQLQPAVAALDERHLLALLRDAGPAPGQVQAAVSDDAGEHWQALPPLPVGNPNSSLALLRLADGRLLLAGNALGGRNVLQLWLSADTGQHWRHLRDLENSADAGAEFSYPALLQGRDGRIHIAYTWQRQTIRHAVFTPAWLETRR